MSIRVLGLVHGEIIEAAIYLQNRRVGGAAFLDEVCFQFDEISADPESFPRWELNPCNVEIRRARHRHFPYVIFSLAIQNEIVIVAVRHGSQSGETWLKHLHLS